MPLLLARSRHHRKVGRTATFLGAVAFLALGAVLASCTTAATFDTSNEPGYVSSDGTVTAYDEDDRPESISFRGTTDAGDELDSADLLGAPVVVNFWYASCPPCRTEAPWLADLARDYMDEVAFVGVNIRDDPATSAAFGRTFEIPYPSIIDADGEVVSAFRGQASPQAVPTTIVLDAQGRPAVRIIGLIDKDVLDAAIASAIDELESGSVDG